MFCNGQFQATNGPTDTPSRHHHSQRTPPLRTTQVRPPSGLVVLVSSKLPIHFDLLHARLEVRDVLYTPLRTSGALSLTPKSQKKNNCPRVDCIKATTLATTWIHIHHCPNTHSRCQTRTFVLNLAEDDIHWRGPTHARALARHATANAKA